MAYFVGFSEIFNCDKDQRLALSGIIRSSPGVVMVEIVEVLAYS